MAGITRADITCETESRIATPFLRWSKAVVAAEGEEESRVSSEGLDLRARFFLRLLSPIFGGERK